MTVEQGYSFVGVSVIAILGWAIMLWREGLHRAARKAWADGRAWMQTLNRQMWENITKDNRNLRGQLKAAEGDQQLIAWLRASIEKQRGVNALLTQEVKDDAVVREGLKRDLASLTDARASLVAELAGEREAHEVTRRNGEASIAALRADVAGLRQRVKTAEEDSVLLVVDAHDERDAAREVCDVVRKERDAIRAVVDIVRDNLNAAMKERDAAVAERDKARQTASVLRGKMGAVRGQLLESMEANRLDEAAPEPVAATPPPGFRAVKVDKVVMGVKTGIYNVWNGGKPATVPIDDIRLPEGVKLFDRDVTVFVREGVSV